MNLNTPDIAGDRMFRIYLVVLNSIKTDVLYIYPIYGVFISQNAVHICAMKVFNAIRIRI